MLPRYLMPSFSITRSEAVLGASVLRYGIAWLQATYDFERGVVGDARVQKGGLRR